MKNNTTTTIYQVVSTPWIPNEGDVRFAGTLEECQVYATRMNTPSMEALGYHTRIVKVETTRKDGGTLRSIIPC